jgi:hypothetical protein
VYGAFLNAVQVNKTMFNIPMEMSMALDAANAGSRRQSRKVDKAVSQD